MQDIRGISIEELLQGYTVSKEACQCLYCGQTFEQGEIFPMDNRFFTAEKAVIYHLSRFHPHPHRLQELLDKNSSLTENQRELFRLFSQGLSDKEIANVLHISPSTVRHQKFVFRERAKAAKLYLAAWSLVEETMQTNLLSVHQGATMVDERYNITEEESQKILENVFESLEPLKLKVLSSKEKKKIVILRKIAQQFEEQRRYSEKEVNALLQSIYEDYVTLRRYLIEYGFLDRLPDCSEYWKK